jgi:hypothetical protein
VKIIEVETIPVRMPIGFYKDGEDKTGGKNAPKKFYKGEPMAQKPRRDARARRIH